MISIKFNNTNLLIEECTLKLFLENNKYTDSGFAVAINRKFIPSSQFVITKLNDNDQIEIIRPMQGG